MRLAEVAGLKPSTAQKFRMGHINEPGAFKLAKLAGALAARAVDTVTAEPDVP